MNWRRAPVQSVQHEKEFLAIAMASTIGVTVSCAIVALSECPVLSLETLILAEALAALVGPGSPLQVFNLMILSVAGNLIRLVTARPKTGHEGESL